MDVLNLMFGYFLGGGETPLHKPYPYSLHRFSDSSTLGTNEMFGEYLILRGIFFRVRSVPFPLESPNLCAGQAVPTSSRASLVES